MDATMPTIFPTALIMPDTLPDPIAAGMFLVLLDRLAFLQPTEEHHPLLRQLINRGYAESRVPLPLGSELPRFASLAREMKKNGREYGRSYLENLFQTNPHDREELSVHGIASRLAGHSGASQDASQSDARERERDWQARLFLTLAEALAEEEDEIARRMSAIARQKKNLLADLQGDTDDIDDSFAELEGMLPDAPPHCYAGGQLDAFRQRAWARLHFRDDAADFGLLATTSQGNAQFLLEGYEKLHQTAPVRLCTLRLPATPPADGDDYAAYRETMRAKNETCRMAIAEAFLAFLSGREEAAVAAAKLDSAAVGWNSLFTSGAMSLTAYAMAGTDSRSLLARLMLEPVPAKADQSRFILLAAENA